MRSVDMRSILIVVDSFDLIPDLWCPSEIRMLRLPRKMWYEFIGDWQRFPNVGVCIIYKTSYNLYVYLVYCS